MPQVPGAVPTGIPLGANPPEAVFIGASTGGPAAVERILRELPHTFRVPICVCQHMSPGFTKIWAERLDGICGLRVAEARYGEALRPRHVYIAPVGKHMRFKAEKGERTVMLDRDFADSLHVPSIDIFMSSAAQAFGSGALGVLLTGLGADGALGMLAIRRAGGYTLAQTEDSAVAPSMPSSAKELGAVAEECAIEQMAHAIARRVSGREDARIVSDPGTYFSEPPVQ